MTRERVNAAGEGMISATLKKLRVRMMLAVSLHAKLKYVFVRYD